MLPLTKKPVFLCVANWDSNVGYAWWLMESFWMKINDEFSSQYEVIITYPSISTLPKAIHDSGIRTIEFNFWVKKISDLLAHIRLIKKYNIQAIYFSDRAIIHWSYILFRCAGVKKIAVHDHTPGVRTRPTGLRRLIKTIYARLPFAVCDTAIGATEYVRRRLININRLPVRKCFAAPNGLPPYDTATAAPPNLQEQLGISGNDLLIVSTGRASLYKGIDFALQVISHLVHSQNIQGFHFVHCGDGPDLDHLKNMARTLKIDRQVTFLGKVTNVNQILHACDIAFHPSRGEVGYSLSILEYMRAGLPVLVSDNPSVCEATCHNLNGLIYQENSLQDACQKLTLLLTNPSLRQSLGNEGIRAVTEKYSLAATHESLILALKKMLQK